MSHFPTLGFISPDGEIISCKYCNHELVAKEVCKKKSFETFNPVHDLVDKLGYVYVGVYTTGRPLIDYTIKNAIQTELIEKLVNEIVCLSFEEYKDMINPNEKENWGIVFGSWDKIKKQWLEELYYEVSVLEVPTKYEI